MLVEVAVPVDMVDEVQAIAAAADRAMSWIVERAYDLARARLHHARRT